MTGSVTVTPWPANWRWLVLLPGFRANPFASSQRSICLRVTSAGTAPPPGAAASAPRVAAQQGVLRAAVDGVRIVLPGGSSRSRSRRRSQRRGPGYEAGVQPSGRTTVRHAVRTLTRSIGRCSGGEERNHETAHARPDAPARPGLPGRRAARGVWGPAGQGGVATGASGPPVTLTFMSGRGIAMDQFKPAWTAYGEQHHVTFEVERTANVTENAVKLTALFAADQAPDLFDANTTFLPRMYDSGAVLRLDAYLAGDKIALERDWAVLGIERWRQKTYALPYWVEPFAVYYNKSLFRQRGVEDPWTRSRSQGDLALLPAEGGQ